MDKKLFLIICMLCSFLAIEKNYVEANAPVKLTFNPAVEGGSPYLLIEPISEKTNSVKNLLLTAYAFDNSEIILATKIVSTTETLHFVLPDRGKEDILGVRIEEIEDSKKTVIKEWRALYRPGKKLIDFLGSKNLKPPSDFQKYWDDAKQKLASVPMNPEILPVLEKSTPTGKLYKVKLNSYNNIPIVCWYYVPKDVNPLSTQNSSGRKYPAIQIMPGWGAEEPPLDRTAEGFITLSLNPRAHGPSKEYFTTTVEHHLWNIDKPEEYYYRSAYMDCLCGIEFLARQSEVDKKRIGVEGGSQGGAFALAVAGLDNRIACAVANVPYISNFPDFVRLATNGSGTAFGRLMDDPVKGKIIQKTLSYIDVSNFTPLIQCPTMICIGLQDRVCPPTNGIVALNRLPKNVPRQLIIDPSADHEVTTLMRKENKEWFEKYLYCNTKVSEK